MTKIVVDCGSCGPDFHSIRQFVTANFDAMVLQSHDAQETLKLMRQRDVALVTVNRKLDRDHSDGMDVVRQIRSEPDFDPIPVMLITNYEEHQLAAIKAGCVRGFGKLALRDPGTVALVQSYLGSP